jgi:hypothetical protein
MTSVKRFNWIREPTGWQRVQKWRATHAKVSQQAMDYGTSASNAFANAQVNMTTGMATIAAKVGNQRVQSQAAASRNQLGSVADLLNTLA